MLTITVEDLIRFGPCYEGCELDDLLELFRSRPVWTALDIAALTQYSAADRLWLLLRPELIPDLTLHELACEFTERALTRERDAGREPHPRSWDAIAAKRKWLAGEIGDSELRSARWAARAVARAVARSADAAADADAAASASVDARYVAARYVAAMYVAADAAADAAASASAAADAVYVAAADAARAARSEAAEYEWQLAQVVSAINL
jgi:hypothetical protein